MCADSETVGNGVAVQYLFKLWATKKSRGNGTNCGF